MRTIGNILWFIFAGVWLALGYALAGLVMCITTVSYTHLDVYKRQATS